MNPNDATRNSAPSVEVARQRWPHVFMPSLARRIRPYLGWGGLLIATICAAWRTGFFDLGRFIEGVGKLGWLLDLMFPPAANGWLGEFAYAMLETLGMAFFGTLLAALLATPIGFLGAKNVVPNWFLHFGLRRGFDGLRGVDTLIWALIFVNVVGLGPFAGILAIMVADTGTFAKLFAEAIENVDRRQVEGVRAAGAREIEVVRFGILPQVIPVMLSQTLYYFESNTRSATILGIVGAGGIGLQLSDRIRVNNWDEACLIIIMILMTVSIIDHLSSRLRMRIIQAEEYRP